MLLGVCLLLTRQEAAGFAIMLHTVQQDGHIVFWFLQQFDTACTSYGVWGKVSELYRLCCLRALQGLQGSKQRRRRRPSRSCSRSPAQGGASTGSQQRGDPLSRSPATWASADRPRKTVKVRLFTYGHIAS